ncbi:MAG: glycosyltransferase [Symploca sp. SIO2B6]|nr:glycosyltransferase [Symploca sp. SIO2B6]
MVSSEHCPKVSIVTPSYSQAKFIERTLLSVLRQDYPNLEYIVVDGNSTDGSKRILNKYSEKLAHLVIEPDEGQTDALNKGFSLATGEIIAYINSDDCYANETVVSTAVRVLQENNDIDLVYGKRYFVNASGIFINAMPFRPFDRSLLYLNDYIPQECSFWTREIFEKSGSFVNSTFDFAMDYELWLRFLDHGASFLAVNEVFGLFRWYDGQKSQNAWRTKGLPEIERLHRQYTGFYIEEAKMMDYYQQHYFLAHPKEDADAYAFCYRLWEKQLAYRRQILKSPLDLWALDAS